MSNSDIGVVIALAGVAIALGFNIYQAVRNRSKDNLEMEKRLVALETKMGLFWGMIEDNVAKYLHNPWTPEEQEALDDYIVNGPKTTTPHLRVLEAAIERKAKTETDTLVEANALSSVLGAIKAQLVDRGETVEKHVLQ